MRNFNDTIVLWVGVALLALSAGAHAAVPVPTDKELGFVGNTRDELRSSIKRIGMLPAQVLFADRPDAEQAVQDAVARYLTQAGFEVVPPDTFRAAYDRFHQQLGGMYDPRTGELKEDVFRAVHENALREFISKERLDGFVTERVVRVGAPYVTTGAWWDGVPERVDGKKVDAVTGFLMDWGSNEGTIPALSLRVQVVTAQSRVAFVRQGGIQLTTYFAAAPGKRKTFLHVAPADLLRDLARIDRAARVATLPLVRTPKEIRDGDRDPQINAGKIALTDLPDPPPAQTHVRETPLKVPREQILASVKRVAMSPVLGSDIDLPQEARERIREQVRSELAPLNWEIVDTTRIRDLLRSRIEASQVYDPFTGRRDEALMTEIRKTVLREVSAESPVDAVLWLAVEQTNAVQRNGEVAWDGVHQNVFARKPGDKMTFVLKAKASVAGQSSIKVSSFVASITDVDDVTLYKSRGGIEVLQGLNVDSSYYANSEPTPVDLAPSELFQDPAREGAAVHVALRDLVMAPEALAAELNPVPGKASRKKKP